MKFAGMRMRSSIATLELTGGSPPVLSERAGSIAPTSDAQSFKYMPFIDGLRAISILAVVAYHVGLPGVPGGFVGVDIFFVISGFLIVNQIKATLSSGRFSIVSFYAHRALRILPLYILVLLLSYVVALFILPTAEIYWDFLASAVLAPLMSTNVLFFLHQGYFDLSAIDKPLLHTWTLSVEEQFYLVAPMLLYLIFCAGKRRFGMPAIVIGMALASASVIGAVAMTSTGGQNAAFYLSQWRAWEFIAGGFIGAQAVAAVRRISPAFVEAMAWIGAAAILCAVAAFNARTAYPSINAALPVAGAVLILLCGMARPDNTVARLLALRPLVAIGLVSYGWYLWHWPLLSFERIALFSEGALLPDALAGGLLAFSLACLSYRYIERPIRDWRKVPGNLKHPRRIVLGFAVACIATSVVGAVAALGGYRSTDSYVASHYGIAGRGVLDNGCDGKHGFPAHCFAGTYGVLIGDSHATVLFGTLAKRLSATSINFVSMARGGCYPLLLSPSRREPTRRDDCARLIAPFERVLREEPTPSFVIISGNWAYAPEASRLLSDMISEFDASRTRILLIGPVPMFARSSLECVVLSDRYGISRDRCAKPRADVEAQNAAIIDVLKAMTVRFPNVRYIDPIDVFCDPDSCRPYSGDTVFYLDSHHLSPAGVDALYDSFAGDFAWLIGNR